MKRGPVGADVTGMPFAPLEAYVRVNYEMDVDAYAQSVGAGRPSIAHMADVCGVSGQTIIRWRQTGWIPWRAADRVACRLHIHPSELWHEWTSRLEPATCT